MREKISGKIIFENENCLLVETPLNLDAKVIQSIYVIPKDSIVGVNGIPKQFWENFACVGNMVEVVVTDDFKFKLNFQMKRRG